MQSTCAASHSVGGVYDQAIYGKWVYLHIDVKLAILTMQIRILHFYYEKIAIFCNNEVNIQILSVVSYKTSNKYCAQIL